MLLGKCPFITNECVGGRSLIPLCSEHKQHGENVNCKLLASGLLSQNPLEEKANADAEAAEPKRRSERLVNKPAPPKAEPKPKKEKAVPKPKKAKEVKKAAPEEKEAPAENGEAKAEEEEPATEEPEQKEDAAE